MRALLSMTGNYRPDLAEFDTGSGIAFRVCWPDQITLPQGQTESALSEVDSRGVAPRKASPYPRLVLDDGLSGSYPELPDSRVFGNFPASLPTRSLWKREPRIYFTPDKSLTINKMQSARCNKRRIISIFHLDFTVDREQFSWSWPRENPATHGDLP